MFHRFKDRRAQASSFIVDQVNPKLKFYNRPLLLALLIGAATAVGTVVLYVRIANDCQIFVSVIPSKYLVQQWPWYSRQQDWVCFYDMFEIMPSGERLDCLPTDYDKGAVPVCAPEAYPSGNEHRSSAMLSAPKCEYPIAYVEAESCPGVVASLGSALGYTGVIELFMTVVIVGILKLCRVIKGKEDSDMKHWILEIIQQAPVAIEASTAAANVKVEA